MSENKNEQDIDEILERMEKDAELERLQESVAFKKAMLDDAKYTRQLEDQKTLECERKAIQSLNLDAINQDYLNQALDEHSKYLDLARDRMRFMLPCFDSVVPLFPHNLLLFGAVTGKGKSSTAAQAIYSALCQVNQNSKRPCRVLHITNEENMGEVYTRVAFIFKGWKYTRLDALTEEQRRVATEFQREMQQSKRLVVIDSTFPELRQPTTSIEGLRHFLESIERNKNDFDIVVIDYFNKISTSLQVPSMNPTDVLTWVCNLLDEYRKRLKCAFIVFTQLHPKNSEKTQFEDRIKSRKMILEPATFAAEIEPDLEGCCTHFHVYKNRLVQGTVDTKVTVGYDRDTGQFVEMDTEFQKKIAQWRY